MWDAIRVKTPRKRPQQVEILLVEDSPDEAYLIGECFTEAKIDHTLHNVEDGASAVEFLHKRGDHKSAPRPDLILLDLNLPKLSGLDVLLQIKEDPDLRRIPVVILSGARDEAVKRECLDLHANCYFTKPFSAGDYLKTDRVPRSGVRALRSTLLPAGRAGTFRLPRWAA